MLSISFLLNIYIELLMRLIFYFMTSLFGHGNMKTSLGWVTLSANLINIKIINNSHQQRGFRHQYFVFES
jgi:hypothetical protein